MTIEERQEAAKWFQNRASHTPMQGAKMMFERAAEALSEGIRWIPCSERLPEAEYGESDNVLTTCIYKDAVDGYRSVKTLYYNGGVWCYPTGETFEGKVLAWMPLPNPYGGENDV